MPREMISLPHDVEYLSLLDKDLEPDLSDELLLAFLGHPTPISPPGEEVSGSVDMKAWVSFVGVLASGLALLLAGCGGPTQLPVASTSEPTAMVEATATTAPSVAPTALPTVAPPPAGGGEGQGNADVLQVRAVQDTDGTWTFHVTVEHPDTGWEDYADGWDVVTPDGTILKPDPDSQFTRTLLHPHENEQPFTRSQSGIEIPEGVTNVRVRAHDLVDGFGGQEVVVDLTAESGQNFEVVRE